MNKDSINQLPRARKNNLIIKELDDETLVYDRENDQAHCLNSTAGLVWKYCDGRTSLDGIATSVEREINSSIEAGVVWLALEQLEKFNLLEKLPSKPMSLAGMSRRQWVRNMGVAAVALPLIVSITAPLAQAVGSLIPPLTCTGASPSSCPTNPCSGGGICQKVTGQCVCV